MGKRPGRPSSAHSWGNIAPFWVDSWQGKAGLSQPALCLLCDAIEDGLSSSSCTSQQIPALGSGFCHEQNELLGLCCGLDAWKGLSGKVVWRQRALLTGPLLTDAGWRCWSRAGCVLEARSLPGHCPRHSSFPLQSSFVLHLLIQAFA